jgi:hypothetical protein
VVVKVEVGRSWIMLLSFFGSLRQHILWSTQSAFREAQLGGGDIRDEYPLGRPFKSQVHGGALEWTSAKLCIGVCLGPDLWGNVHYAMSTSVGSPRQRRHETRADCFNLLARVSGDHECHTEVALTGL